MSALAAATVLGWTLAVVGWVSFWCAEDKIRALARAYRSFARAAARTEVENARLRAVLERRRAPRPPIVAGDVVAFDRVHAAIGRPVTTTRRVDGTTEVWPLNEATEEWHG